EGEPALLVAFAGRLRSDAPPLARVDAVHAAAVPATGAPGFRIVDSRAGGDRPARTYVAPDVAVCDACLRELADPADRRYRHPRGGPPGAPWAPPPSPNAHTGRPPFHAPAAPPLGRPPREGGGVRFVRRGPPRLPPPARPPLPRPAHPLPRLRAPPVVRGPQ